MSTTSKPRFSRIVSVGIQSGPTWLLRICQIGPRQADATAPTIQSRDMVVLDRTIGRRRKPQPGHIYAVNGGPLTDNRRRRAGALSSDCADKMMSPTRTFAITAATLPEALVGQVVWVGRTLAPGRSD